MLKKNEIFCWTTVVNMIYFIKLFFSLFQQHLSSGNISNIFSPIDDSFLGVQEPNLMNLSQVAEIPTTGSNLESLFKILTLFLLGGGVNLTPPLQFFLHNSKSIGLRLLKFSDFSYISKALPLGLKPGFNTNCLSPQTHCLNDCFFL